MIPPIWHNSFLSEFNVNVMLMYVKEMLIIKGKAQRGKGTEAQSGKIQIII